MLEARQYDFCNEFYFVDKSMEVVVTLRDGPRRIRIDTLRSPDPPIRYGTISYIEEEILVQLVYPEPEGDAERKPQSLTTWVCYDLPWTDGASADAALAQALSFLRERCPT
jgi:hypothetical protein